MKPERVPTSSPGTVCQAHKRTAQDGEDEDQIQKSYDSVTIMTHVTNTDSPNRYLEPFKFQ